jgi:HlyD family secretion protein
MTANVLVKVGNRENVLKLPNAALRYRPEKVSGPPAPPKGEKGKPIEVWVLREGKEVGVPVTLGLSDGAFTEVVAGDLKPGDAVITEKLRKSGGSGSGRPPSMRGF